MASFLSLSPLLQSPNPLKICFNIGGLSEAQGGCSKKVGVAETVEEPSANTMALLITYELLLT